MIGISFAQCRAWFHDAPANRAVIICSPLGFEELCARQSLRILADKLAASGVPALRFDYAGTADSIGGDDDAGLVQRWRDSIAEAARWLKSEAGIDEFVLAGMRLGSLLAALESNAIAGLKGLALLAPAASGRAYLRETVALGNIVAPPSPAGVTREPKRAGEIDLCGFAIAPQTAQDISALSLAGFKPADPLDVLLMPQKGASPTTLQRAFQDAGCPVSVAAFSGYDGMICDPTAAKVPADDLETIVRWVSSLGRVKTRRIRAIAPRELSAPAWTETAITFGPQGRLAGILCEPRASHGGTKPCFIFTNAGMNYHIGWARMTVRHARALAEHGYASLRYDTSGIGDSAADPANPRFPLYDKISQDDLSSAVDAVCARGLEAPAVVGACSGAYTAFHATTADRRIRKAAIINLQCFAWTPAIGYELERWRRERVSEIVGLRHSEGDKSAARKAGRSRYTAAGALRLAGRLFKRACRAVRRSPLARRDNAIVKAFRAISGRGTQVMMIYSRGDEGLQEFEANAGAMGHRVTGMPGVSLRFLDNADHNLTSRPAQDAALKLLIDLARGPR